MRTIRDVLRLTFELKMSRRVVSEATGIGGTAERRRRLPIFQTASLCKRGGSMACPDGTALVPLPRLPRSAWLPRLPLCSMARTLRSSRRGPPAWKPYGPSRLHFRFGSRPRSHISARRAIVPPMSTPRYSRSIRHRGCPERGAGSRFAPSRRPAGPRFAAPCLAAAPAPRTT